MGDKRLIIHWFSGAPTTASAELAVKVCGNVGATKVGTESTVQFR
jgi:hypothetical protein